MRTLEEVLATRSPESQTRIKEMADEIILETARHIVQESPQPDNVRDFSFNSLYR